MDHHVPSFATKLDRVMSECNLSRVTLARELGLDKSVIARWLGNINRPTGHNLTRLTDLIRRYRPDVTLDYWRDEAGDLLEGPDALTMTGDGPVIRGLRAPRRPEIDANYPGFWAGFYQSTQNRGSLILCAMRLTLNANGLRAIFTEGRATASGGIVVIGARVHAVLELEPRHDRLCMFVFNGVGAPDSLAMDGIYAISAGEAEVCATSAPILMFRVGDVADFERAGGFARIRSIIFDVNSRNVKVSVEAGNPAAGLADLAPDVVLNQLCATVGTRGPDGETDFVMRMAPHRALPHTRYCIGEAPQSSPMLQTRNNIRRLFGLS